MNKQELRKRYKQKREELSEIEIKHFEQIIYRQIVAFDFSSVHTIHIFLPIKRQKEVNTYPIIDFLRKEGKQIIISKSDFKTSTLTHFLFEKDTSLEVNKWGIPEPVGATEVNVKEIDFVFVPLLISDEQNYRVGYGKGFYDRFLSACKKEVKTMGLNFFPPIKKIEDINEFDVPLDVVLYAKQMNKKK